jgi:hypothetical protein
VSIEFNIGSIRTRIKGSEWGKAYKDYPKECGEVSVYELKMLMAYMQELESVTRWGVWLEDYITELKERHTAGGVFVVASGTQPKHTGMTHLYVWRLALCLKSQ